MHIDKFLGIKFQWNKNKHKNFLRCYLINNILSSIKIIHNNDVLMTKMSFILLVFVINSTVTHIYTQTTKYKHIQIGKPEPFVKNKQSRRTVNIWSIENSFAFSGYKYQETKFSWRLTYFTKHLEKRKTRAEMFVINNVLISSTRNDDRIVSVPAV